MPGPLDKYFTPDAVGTMRKAYGQGLSKHNPEGDIPELPPPPSGFQVNPVVLGANPALTSAIHGMVDVHPGVKQRLNERGSMITVGPNADTFDEMYNSGLRLEDYERTNLLGTTNRRTGNISLNPRTYAANPLKGLDILSTLAHELKHVADRHKIFPWSSTETEARKMDAEIKNMGGRTQWPVEGAPWPKPQQGPQQNIVHELQRELSKLGKTTIKVERD